MIVNGINKYVTEMSEETQENHIDVIGDSTKKPVAKARSKQTSMPTTSSPTVTFPYHQRDWIDVEPGQYDKSCFEVSMAELLAKGGSPKKRFQYCVDPYSADTIQYLSAIRGHSGGKHINPSLQDNMLLPSDFAEHIYHV